MSDELNTLLEEARLIKEKGKSPNKVNAPISEDGPLYNGRFHVVKETIKGKTYWMIYQKLPKWAQFLNRKGWFFEKRYSPESALRRANELNR